VTIGVGTPRFIAPEVLTGSAVSPRSDVFGLAATLWALIAGAPPMYGSRDQLASQMPDIDPGLRDALCSGMEFLPDRRIPSVEEFAASIGAPLTKDLGHPFVVSIDNPVAPRLLLEAVVRTAAGVFDAASASIGLIDSDTNELIYQAAWGAGAEEIVGVRLGQGTGIVGRVLETGHGAVIADCGNDPRFAAQVAEATGYVPNTMLVVPLRRDAVPLGALSLLDRRDGGSYGPDDIVRAELFADLAMTILGK
jgi:hypothetical protein